jgi:hypothetical protein
MVRLIRARWVRGNRRDRGLASPPKAAQPLVFFTDPGQPTGGSWSRRPELCDLLNLTESSVDLFLAVAAVTAQSPDRGKLSAFGPPANRLRIHPEKLGDFSRRQKLIPLRLHRASHCSCPTTLLTGASIDPANHRTRGDNDGPLGPLGGMAHKGHLPCLCQATSGVGNPQ